MLASSAAASHQPITDGLHLLSGPCKSHHADAGVRGARVWWCPRRRRPNRYEPPSKPSERERESCGGSCRRRRSQQTDTEALSHPKIVSHLPFHPSNNNNSSHRSLAGFTGWRFSQFGGTTCTECIALLFFLSLSFFCGYNTRFLLMPASFNYGPVFIDWPSQLPLLSL